MKFALLFILLATTCNILRPPDVLKIDCSNQPNGNCLYLTLDSSLKIVFKDALSSLIKNEQQVGVFCDIFNNTNDTILFQAQKFTLLSKQNNFLPISFGKFNSNNFKLDLYDKVLKIPPNASFKNYVLSYKSEKKLLYKQYENILNTDTFNLMYRNNYKSYGLLRLTYTKRKIL